MKQFYVKNNRSYRQLSGELGYFVSNTHAPPSFLPIMDNYIFDGEKWLLYDIVKDSEKPHTHNSASLQLVFEISDGKLTKSLRPTASAPVPFMHSIFVGSQEIYWPHHMPMNGFATDDVLATWYRDNVLIPYNIQYKRHV